MKKGFCPVKIKEKVKSDLKNLREDYYNPFFSHIYVETAIKDHPRTQRILAKFPDAVVVEIGHYKDVFCRSKQSCRLQHRSQSLILAARQGTLIYEGAPVCHSFGNQYFCTRMPGGGDKQTVSLH